MKHAFTMIELIYVIVILGILSAVAIPKFASTRNMADIGVARSDVAVIRSAIMSERQSRLITGDNAYIGKLSSSTTLLFTGDTKKKRTLLTYGIVAGSSKKDAGKWTASDKKGLNYAFRADTVSVVFKYDPKTGKFTCNRKSKKYGTQCKQIID